MKPKVNKDFCVTTTRIEDGNYSKWHHGTVMTIAKNGVEIELDGKEIQELVSTLPRTIGGVY